MSSAVIGLTPLDEARVQQRRAADPTVSVFVTANAGSGKTTTLVDRVARLLLREVEPGEILCVTYTKAAAAEMQARLFEKLGVWAVADDAALEIELAKLDGADPKSFSHADLSSARRLFARALETPGGLKIQTIHAFCEKLLKRFPLEAGVSPGFRVLENEAAVALSRSARQELARLALKAPDGPIGRAYAHFAVALDWGAFNDLLGMLEAKREDLAAYVDAVDAGVAPDSYGLTLADPDRTPEDIEGDFLDWIDQAEWDNVADGMATGSTTDQDRAEAMRAASVSGWTVEMMAGVFLTQAGSPRASMGTKKAPPAAVAWLSDLQLKYLAMRRPRLHRPGQPDRASSDRTGERRLGPVQAGRRHRTRPDRRGSGHGAGPVAHLPRSDGGVLFRRRDRTPPRPAAPHPPHRLRRGRPMVV